MRHHEEDGEGYDELEDDDDGYDGNENDYDGIICDDEFVSAMSMGLSITTNKKIRRLFHPSIKLSSSSEFFHYNARCLNCSERVLLPSPV